EAFPHLGAQLGDALLELRVDLSQPLLELRVELGPTLFDLGVEPREVQLVQLPQVGSVRGVHRVEPLHEFVGDLVAKLLIELSGQLGSDRHSSSLERTVTTVTISSAQCGINKTRGEPFLRRSPVPFAQ